MGRVIALDVGDVRIGIAVCDEMRLIASPHSVYRRVGFGPDVKHIKALCDQLGTRDIVCGLPRNMDGSIGFQAQKVQALAEQLARNTHEVWAAQRLKDGWVWGPSRDDAQKQHPCLVPYEELPEEEKDYDRHTALETLRLIQSMGFEIRRAE